MTVGGTRGASWKWSYAGIGILFCGSLLRGQVFSATGGVSTIANAQGGQLTVNGPAYSFSIGGGEAYGQLAGGFRYVRQTPIAKLTLGDQYARFDLATDVFDPGHFVDLLGAGVETNIRHTSVMAFVGATSTDMSNPIFSAASADHFAGALFLRKTLAPGLKATSYTLLSNKLTSIEGLQWQAAEHLTLAVSGGVGAGHAYGAASLNYVSPQFDLKAAYIYANPDFQRYIGRSPALAEPDRGNIAFTWKPAGQFTLTGGHQTFLSSPSSSTPGLRTSLDDLSVGVSWLGAEITATTFHSAYMATSTYAIACSISREFGQRFSLQESYLEAWPSSGPSTTTVLTNMRETLTPRWAVSELITQSAGQNSAAIGGSFLSNRAAVSLDYQNYYVSSRVRDPFQRAVIADVELHVMGRLNLHGATYVDPQGKLKYTADANCLLDRQGSEHTSPPRIVIGESMVRGRVIDQNGIPVAGAALQFDDLMIYSDSGGRFFLRERRARLHKLKVMTDRFLNTVQYFVVDAPSSVSSGGADRNETVIVLSPEP